MLCTHACVWHWGLQHVTLLGVFQGAESCALMKLVRVVVFGVTLSLFAFPKSLPSFRFTTPCFELRPPPWSFQTLRDGTGVSSLSGLSSITLIYFFLLHKPRINNLDRLGFAYLQIAPAKTRDFVRSSPAQCFPQCFDVQISCEDVADFAASSCRWEGAAHSQLLTTQECDHTSTDSVFRPLSFSRIQHAKFKLTSSCVQMGPDALDSGWDEYSRSFWDKQTTSSRHQRHSGHSSAARSLAGEKTNCGFFSTLFLSPRIINCVCVFVLCPFVAALMRARDVVCLEFSL